MATQPVSQILNREGAIEKAKFILDVATPLFQELVNYGTKILYKSVFSSEGQKTSGTATLALYKQILENADGFEVLLSNCCTFPIELILRTTFEALISLEYIFETKSEYINRSLSYVFFSLRDRLRSLMLLDPTSEDRKQLIANISKDKKINKFPLPDEKDFEDEIYYINELLNGDEFRQIQDEFTKYKNKKYINWFNLFNGPKSIKKLAENIGFAAQYQLMYGPWSRRIHAKDISTLFDGSIFGIIPIREIEILKIYPLFESEFIIDATELVINNFLPNEDYSSYKKNVVKPLIDQYSKLVSLPSNLTSLSDQYL